MELILVIIASYVIIKLVKAFFSFNEKVNTVANAVATAVTEVANSVAKSYKCDAARSAEEYKKLATPEVIATLERHARGEW